MPCPCGGTSLASGSAMLKAESEICYLSFGTCRECGRVGMETLHIDGALVMTDSEARNTFQEISSSGKIPDGINRTDLVSLAEESVQASFQKPSLTEPVEGQFSLF